MSTSSNEDLARMALVMGLSALDTYLHWAILKKVYEKKDSLPTKFKKLKVEFGELATLANQTIAAQQDEKPKDNQKKKLSRPWVKVKLTLQKQLRYQTFQSPRQIDTAMNLIGISSIWSTIATKRGEKAEVIITKLNKLYDRRNQIAHEGDLHRLARPRNISLNEISPKYTSDALDWLEKLIQDIDVVVSTSHIK